VMAYFLIFQRKGGVSGEGAAQIRQMQEMTEEVRRLESDVTEKKDEIFSLVDEYKEKTGEATLGVNALDLGENEKKILEQRISKMRGQSRKYYPKFYNENIEYKIEMSGDNQTAIVAILDTLKFKNERIELSVK
jgi:predicted nuclease with TOPRIM domain